MGGVDQSGKNYTWTLTNHEASPVIKVGFPHYKADLFTPPPGWVGDCTGKFGAQWSGEPGECTAEAPSERDGIPKGGRAEFSLRVPDATIPRGTGEVTVGLAGGEVITVGGVRLPVAPPWGDQYSSLFALTVIFAGFLLIQVLKRRKARPASGAEAAVPPERHNGTD